MVTTQQEINKWHCSVKVIRIRRFSHR